jgi:tetratricopeptide (TPR) repeat protein
MNQELFKEAVALFESARLADAHDKFILLYQEDKGNADVNYYLGHIACKWDNYDQAIDYLNRSAELNESDARVHEMLGQAYGLKAQRVGVVKAAMMIPKIRKSFQRAVELNPQSISAREGLFMFYLFTPGMAGGDEKKALEIAGELSALNPARGLVAQALHHMKHGQALEAQQAFISASEQAMTDAEIQMRAGRFLLEKKEQARALDCFNRYITLRKFDPAGYDAKGECLSRMGKHDEALQAFQAALNENPKFVVAHLHRADTLAAMGRAGEAREAYKSVIENYRGTPLAEKAGKALASLA